MPPSPDREPFIPDADVVRRAQRINGNTTAARVQVIADRPGNPLSAEIRRFGEAVACRAPVFGGEHLFNRAFGFTDEQLDDARQVIAWYEESGAGGFEVPPGLPCQELFALLHAHAFRQTSFHAFFGGRPTVSAAAPGGVEVLRLEDASHLEAFSDAYHRGWGQTGMRVPLEPWLAVPGWSLYLGLCEGQPAGAALLCLSGGDAYLADSAVDPDFRRRGLHRALLDRRCADAAEAGADIVFSGADFLSNSYRNMLRLGLSLLFTKAVWTLDRP